ncbi:hypothetical protein MTO96_041770 [Rhipicephalus appendiculatus]
MTKRYNLRDRERDNSEMNGDGAGNLQALGVADSGTGGHGSASDTASEQQLALLQLQLKIAEAETEKQRLMLESQRLRARDGAESNEGGDSVSLGGGVIACAISRENEKWKTCVSSSCAEATCEAKTIGPGCTPDCQRGCFCSQGFDRDSQRNCVREDQCPTTAQV